MAALIYFEIHYFIDPLRPLSAGGCCALFGIILTELPLPLNEALPGAVAEPDPLTDVLPLLIAPLLPPTEPAAAAEPVLLPDAVLVVPVLPAVSP